MEVVKVEKGTRLMDFLDGLPEEALDQLSELIGESTVRTETIEGLGEVEVYLSESSEGADRGGYVLFVKLLGFVGPNGPVVLEEEPCEGWLLEGRMSSF